MYHVRRNPIKEDTDAAYVSWGMKGHLASLPWNLLVGVRYERTDVKAISNVLPPTALLWQDNNDFSVTLGTNFAAVKDASSYHNTLPSLDFDMNLRDDLKARFSYSKTIARPQYNDLRSAVVINGTQGSTINGFVARYHAVATSSPPARISMAARNPLRLLGVYLRSV